MDISQQCCTLQLGFNLRVHGHLSTMLHSSIRIQSYFDPLSALTSIHHAEPYSPSIPLKTAPPGPNLADRLTLLAVGSPEEAPVSEMHC